MDKNIIPVLLGADLNCYSVARAFFEAYGVTSYAFGKYPLGVTAGTKFISFTSVPDLSNYDTADGVLIDFAKRHTGNTLYLVGCTDEYAEYIIRRQNILKEYYFIAATDGQRADTLIDKASFYKLCEKYNLPYPKTRIVENGENISAENYTDEKLDFKYPIVIKPSSSIKYWKNPFENMKKVYFSDNAEQTAEILSVIFASGYDDSVILQDKIPGNDEYMYVLTAYCGGMGKTNMMCLGHVLLEEHSPKAIGNHAAIITENVPALYERFSEFLEKIGYRGFANFDIKYDTRDGEYKVFEINLRQGRSNNYILAAGINIAKLLVEDSKNALGEEKIICENEVFWHLIPKKIVYKYVVDKNIVKKAKGLAKDKKAVSPLFYKYDLKGNIKRRAYIYIHHLKFFGKYKKYM